MLGRGLPKTTKNQECQPLGLHQYLAKSYKNPQGLILPGRSVAEHCQIVGKVARTLLLRLPEWLQKALFPPGSELIAAAHDIGKISPTFQKKIHTALSQKNELLLSEWKEINPDTEKQWGGHAGVSQSAIAAHNVGIYIPQILGQHHGFSPNLALYQASSSVFGGQSWQAQRTTLLDHLKHVLATDFPVINDPLQARAIAGLTTVSDWIGSGFIFEDPQNDWRQNIEKSLDLAGFIQPKVKTGLSFSEVFPFTPKQAQVKLIEAATQPGVYVLEAPMGLGKTEAALYVAYQLLEKRIGHGHLFCAPDPINKR